MRIVVQRVKEANVTVEGKIVGEIQKGFCLLVGFTQGDDEEKILKMAKKISKLRIFEDDQEKMNLSLSDVGGEILSISQFTLYGDPWEGNRPSFTKALGYQEAMPLYERFNEALRELGLHVETGEFGAMMNVHIENDGPVTIWLEV